MPLKYKNYELYKLKSLVKTTVLRNFLTHMHTYVVLVSISWHAMYCMNRSVFKCVDNDYGTVLLNFSFYIIRKLNLKTVCLVLSYTTLLNKQVELQGQIIRELQKLSYSAMKES